MKFLLATGRVTKPRTNGGEQPDGRLCGFMGGTDEGREKRGIVERG